MFLTYNHWFYRMGQNSLFLGEHLQHLFENNVESYLSISLPFILFLSGGKSWISLTLIDNICRPRTQLQLDGQWRSAGNLVFQVYTSSSVDRGMASDTVIGTTQRRITVNMNTNY